MPHNIIRCNWQDDFIRLEEISEEKRESIELKCWAGFATEEKLQEMKLSALEP